MKKIVISGPESTGKTTLTKQLADAFNTVFIPEFARYYIEKKANMYTYQDVEIVARQQIKDLTDIPESGNSFIFYDTGLIITKIWFEEVFNEVPKFLTDSLEKVKIDLCLLCYPDIKWVPDSVRVNKGKKRFDLFTKYERELKRYNINYKIIKGTGDTRFQCAKNFISSAYCL